MTYYTNSSQLIAGEREAEVRLCLAENKVEVDSLQDQAESGRIFCMLRNCLGNIVTFIFKWNFFMEEIHNSSAFLKATLGQQSCAINLVAKSESEM